MKKALSIIFSIVIMMAIFAGCSTNAKEEETTTKSSRHEFSEEMLEGNKEFNHPIIKDNGNEFIAIKNLLVIVENNDTTWYAAYDDLHDYVIYKIPSMESIPMIDSDTERYIDVSEALTSCNFKDVDVMNHPCTFFLIESIPQVMDKVVEIDGEQFIKVGELEKGVSEFLKNS